MPSTTHPAGLVTLDRDQVIEALALTFAAERIMLHQSGGTENPLTSFFLQAASVLEREIFGPFPEEDDEWASHPIIVEVDARGCELAAEAWDLFEDSRGFATAQRERAAAMREAGTVDA